MNTFFAKASEMLRGGTAEKPADETPKPSGDTAVVEPARISIPLYIAGAAAQISGLAAVSYQLAEPGFAYFTVTLTLIGMAVSYHLRRIGTPARLIRAGTLLLGLIFLYAFRGAGFFGAIVPAEAQGSQEMLLVSALAFTATFCSFILLTDEAVIFTCVWAIAMIGLTGTVNINRELILCFIVFLLAAAFLLVHQNSLAYGSGPSKTLTGGFILPKVRWPLLRTQAAMAVIAWSVSITLGFLIAIPVQMLGRNMSLGTIIQRLRVPPAAATRFSGQQRLIFDNLTQFHIGLGPVGDDPTEKMTVLSERPYYWRGRVYDEYNSKGWNSRVAPRVPPLTPEETNSEGLSTFKLPPTEYLRRDKTERVAHQFHVNAGSYAPLYHAAEPVRVRGGMSLVYYKQDNTMGTRMGAVTDYDVESEVLEAKNGDLRRSGTTYPAEIRYLYLNQGRDSVVLQSLAEEAVRGVDNNPYDKASAIRRFIAQRCTYSKEARAVPKDQDAAEFFLTESREGYCDLYATAMVILCRHAGIPARVATGFAPGTAIPDSEKTDEERRDKREKYLLTGNDQHAWAEVYFARYGWVVFDATQDTGGVFTAPTTPKPAPKKSRWERLLSGSRAPLVLTFMGLLGLIYVAVNEAWARLSGKIPTRTGKHGKAVLYGDAITTMYLIALRRLVRRSGPRPPQMTPGEYATHVRETMGPSVADPLEALTRLTESALYGPATVNDGDVAEARAYFNQLTTALKQYRKERSPVAAVPAK